MHKAPYVNNELAVLGGTKMPAVLVECGYMGGDFSYCKDNADKIAEAIYYGIMAFELKYYCNACLITI